MLPPACTECERELVRGAVQKLSQDQTGEQAAMLEKVVVERVRGMLRLPNAILQALPPPLAPPAPPSVTPEAWTAKASLRIIQRAVKANRG